MGSTSVESTNCRLKIFRNKNPRKYTKAKLELPHTQHCAESKWMKWCAGIPCSLCVSTMPFYIRDLRICGFCYPLEGGNCGGWCSRTNPQWILRDSCTFFFHFHFNYLPEVVSFKIKLKLLHEKAGLFLLYFANFISSHSYPHSLGFSHIILLLRNAPSA